MIVGIEASNISRGGGLTHLRELLLHLDVADTPIEKIIVWAPTRTLRQLCDKDWLIKINHDLLDKSIVFRMLWKSLFFEKECIKFEVDVLLVPGTNYSGNKIPYVTIPQNMLPFETKEQKRFGFSWARLRYMLLFFSQSKCLRNAKGIIYLSNYAKQSISKKLNIIDKPSVIIPHGINESFFINKQIENKKIRSFLYISIINTYKHQCNVTRAISELRNDNKDVSITFVGPAYKPELIKLENQINKINLNHGHINYIGEVGYIDLPKLYLEHDAFIFASTCENLPNILLEAMATGIPIASSNFGPMPETLKDAGLYFNPENVTEIKQAILNLISNDNIQNMTESSVKYAKEYKWSTCSKNTFNFMIDLIN